MDLLTYGTLVCVSFFPPQARFAKCDPNPTIIGLFCDIGTPPWKCEGAKYLLKYEGCSTYVMDPLILAKYVNPVVLWEEYEKSPGVYVKKPICADFNGGK